MTVSPLSADAIGNVTQVALLSDKRPAHAHKFLGAAWSTSSSHSSLLLRLHELNVPARITERICAIYQVAGEKPTSHSIVCKSLKSS